MGNRGTPPPPKAKAGEEIIEISKDQYRSLAERAGLFGMTNNARIGKAEKLANEGWFVVDCETVPATSIAIKEDELMIVSCKGCIVLDRTSMRGLRNELADIEAHAPRR